MPKSTSTSNNILALIFNATAWTSIADNTASSPTTNLYLALHTADPGVGNNQTTSEATYTGYARVAVARSTSGWSAPTGGSTQNVLLCQFPECTGGTNTISYISVGTASTGSGTVLYTGELSSSRSITSGKQPQFSASSLIIVEQ